MEDKQLITLQEAAREFNVPAVTLRRAAKYGTLETTRIGQMYAVTREAVNDWLKTAYQTKRGRPRKTK